METFLRVTTDDRGCAFRVTQNPYAPEPTSGGGPSLSIALKNLAWVLDENDRVTPDE